jgi:hypothetical protein
VSFRGRSNRISFRYSEIRYDKDGLCNFLCMYLCVCGGGGYSQFEVTLVMSCEAVQASYSADCKFP